MRRQWELPACKREEGETPLDCAKRELFEETGQSVTDLEFIGLAKVKNIMNGMEKFNPVFYSSIHYLQPFIENQETDGIRLWDVKEAVNIDQVDLAILEYVKNMNLSRSGS
jgi:8-oxo-dGTP diphosphatase